MAYSLGAVIIIVSVCWIVGIVVSNRRHAKNRFEHWFDAKEAGYFDRKDAQDPKKDQ
jgi:hypothetical protein